MYIKLPDIYPYDLGRFPQDFPNTSQQDTWKEEALADFGIYAVTVEERPQIVDHEQYLIEMPPAIIDGKWVQKWTVADRSPEDKQLLTDAQCSQIRDERDRRLRLECDCINPMRWETMTDAQKDLARAHRLALLDVPNQPGFPWSVTWPVNPL